MIEKPPSYLNMALSKFFGIAFIIAMGFATAVVLVMPPDLMINRFFIANSHHPIHEENATIATPKDPECPNKSALIKHPARLENRNLSANVGQYGIEEAAKNGMSELKSYLNDCASFQDNWFCQGLVNVPGKINITREDWAGGYIWYLVIERLDDPTLYALCDYMWNADGKEWARGHYHGCSDFNNRGNGDPN
jgi:hypothetical protein